MHCYSHGLTTPAITIPAIYRPKPVISLKVRAFESKSQLNFYEVLGIPESGSTMEVKHAYKQLARKYHPDVSPPGRVEEYTKKFITVHEAYQTLSDPSKRAIYDTHISHPCHYHHLHQVNEEKDKWKKRWENQLLELKRRRRRNSYGDMSWAARMRHQMMD